MFFCPFVCILIGASSVLAQLPRAKNVSRCGDGEFRCRDGACIPWASRCNGSVECPDRSDEIFATCRNNTCETFEFRCTYGACMELSVRCDEKQDCADNSDELIPLCTNYFTDVHYCQQRLIDDRQESRSVECTNTRWTCNDGQVLKEPTRCDGHVDCADGSDETLARCADAECEPPLFRCAYGGCAFPKAQCDGIEDCADGSDESFELCGRVLPVKTTTTPKPICTLPPQIEHGSYTMGGKAQGVPGQYFRSLVLKFTCDNDHIIMGSSTLFCYNGDWSGDIPKCVRFCRLPKHHSVEYRCPLTSDGSIKGRRECNDLEPAGTIALPRCREPVYYYPGLMLNMLCNDSGKWDNIITCIPECGNLGSTADSLLLQGHEAMRNELPWHVAIYKSSTREQICAGTVVRTNAVISAAHCFWRRNKLQPVSDYMVAAGKLYRTWDHPNDTNAQTSEIREVMIPARFQGSITNFQDDIALLTLVSDFQFTEHVRPVCIDFDFNFDSRQLKVLSVGKIAGWGQTEKGTYSEQLRVADAPYVSIQDCIADTPVGFQAYITSDKICAGYKNGTALCKGDSGGGLTFPARERGTIRYYLRGVASTAVNNQYLCNSASITTFTRVVSHEQFLKEYL